MTHYICTGGCRGRAMTAGVCTSENCPKRGSPLAACECSDGAHEGKQIAGVEDGKQGGPGSAHDDAPVERERENPKTGE